MNDRQRFALVNPLNNGAADTRPYRTVDRQADGLLMVVLLAVDR